MSPSTWHQLFLLVPRLIGSFWKGSDELCPVSERPWRRLSFGAIRCRFSWKPLRICGFQMSLVQCCGMQWIYRSAFRIYLFNANGPVALKVSKVQEITEATEKQQSRRPLPGPQPIDSAHTRQFARNAPSYINVSFHLQDPQVAIGCGRLQGGRTDPFSPKTSMETMMPHGQCSTLESKLADFFAGLWVALLAGCLWTCSGSLVKVAARL